jgi:hypothetical protein
MHTNELKLSDMSHCLMTVRVRVRGTGLAQFSHGHSLRQNFNNQLQSQLQPEMDQVRPEGTKNDT